MKEWKRTHPRAARAHATVARALKAGTLTCQPCEVCGSTTKIEAHHDSYEDALNVRWLCRRHHKEHHRKTRLVQGKLRFGSRKEVSS